jgi:UDP-glucose 4-epimerase
VRYLITGGAGFIGSHLADALVARGDDVIALDDLSTGHERNVAALAGSDRFRLVDGSILDPGVVGELTADVDVVVHLAAAIGVKLIVEQPLRSMRTNIAGTEIVLEAAAKQGRRTLIASTSEVYGRTLEVMHEQADRVLGPTTVARWSYAAAKAIDEHMAYAYAREQSLPVVVVRFFNTVGPRQTGAYAGVLPRLVSQALLGEPLTLYGDGSQTRCFCDVEDVVRALVGLLDDDAALGEAYNIGSTDEVSMRELAERVLELSGSASELSYRPYADVYGENYEDIPRRVPDTSKIRGLIGWAPTHDLNAIVKRMIDHAHEVGPDRLLGQRA